MGDLSTSGDDVGIVRAPQELTHRSSQPSTHIEVFANRESLHALEAQGESEEARLERLGRERPDKFSSLWAEVGFVFSVVMSQILVEYFVSGFTVILPTLKNQLNIPAASITWPTGAYSVAVASTLLIFGRLSDMYGGRLVYLLGVVWYAAWSLVAGFSQNELMLDFCRAFQGLGAAAFLPSSLKLLGSIYKPGPRKNTVFGIYSAAAPLGLFAGIFFAGISGQYTTWAWYFWIGAILAALTAVAAWVSIPPDYSEHKNLGIKMDWLGAGLSASGLLLFVFSLTDSAHAPNGWRTPYIPSLFVVGVLLLVTAVYVEGWVADAPLVPADMFQTKYMKPLLLSLFFFYGGLGINFLYFTLYMQGVLGADPLQLVAWWTPTVVGGVIISVVGGLVLHLVSGTVLALVAGAAWLAAPLLFALAPLGANYWAYIFPAMIATTIGIDVMFNVTNIFITTAMPARRQGLAGSLINMLLQMGIAVFLGAADLVATFASRHRTVDVGSRLAKLDMYRHVMWLDVGLAGTSLLLILGFVRIGKAKSQLTADELEAAETEAGVGIS